tara:strand:+ start:12239 stop:12496 length:258 start_codon:yes stop_codon:yes gene_type:complete
LEYLRITVFTPKYRKECLLKKMKAKVVQTNNITIDHEDVSEVWVDGMNVLSAYKKTKIMWIYLIVLNTLIFIVLLFIFGVFAFLE